MVGEGVWVRDSFHTKQENTLDLSNCQLLPKAVD